MFVFVFLSLFFSCQVAGQAGPVSQFAPGFIVGSLPTPKTEDLTRGGVDPKIITWTNLQQKPYSLKCCAIPKFDNENDGETNCVCKDRVKYKTIHNCAVMQACTNAKRDIDYALTAYPKLKNTAVCVDAIGAAVCAYHFWACEDQLPDKIYNRVCQDTCSLLNVACGINLQNITLGLGYFEGCSWIANSNAVDKNKFCTTGFLLSAAPPLLKFDWMFGIAVLIVAIVFI